MEALKPGDPGAVGRYRLSARLSGSGRLGTVFLGRARDGGTVTVRLVRPDLAADKRFVERFRKTTDAVRRIDGLHLAHVLDADPDGTPPWLVAEYAPGITLEEAVRAHGPLPEDALRALGSALSRALVAVHAAKVVHQGLAAGTVMLTPSGPQITDLGLTAMLGADASAALPAPEQATGGAVGPATDVFALAGVVCQAAGVTPYGDVDAAELAQRVLRTTPELDGVPEDLAALLTRCFARRPDSRPSAAELAELFDGDDAAGTAWLPKGVADAVDAAARVKPPKPPAKSAPSARPRADEAAAPAEGRAVAREAGPGDAPSEDAAADAAAEREAGARAAGPRGGGTPGPRKPVGAEAGARPGTGDDAADDDGNEETVEVGVGVAVAAAVEEDKTAPVPAAETPAPPAAAPTVVTRKPLDEAQLLKPRKPEAPAAAASAAAATPTEIAPRPAPEPPSRPAAPAPAPAASPAPPRPAEAAPTVAAPRWSPAGPPVEDARPAYAASPAGPAGAPPVPSAGPSAPFAETPGESPEQRQASAAVWYAVIVLVGLTSAGLAVYRLADSEWRDLQNPVMGLVLPGVALVFGLAGLVVLALAVSDRRKSSGDPQGT